MIPSLHDCRETWRNTPWILEYAATWWKDDRAMYEVYARTNKIEETDHHSGFCTAMMIKKHHPTAFLCLIAILDGTEKEAKSLAQLGMSELSFFLSGCDEGYVDLMESLCRENEALKITLGWVYQFDGMSDERFARICAMAPRLDEESDPAAK